jgi:hypothetical protein
MNNELKSKWGWQWCSYAGALFAEACIKGLNGEENIQCTYVASNITDLPFFSSKVAPLFSPACCQT